jgi:hypothetical protein
VSTVPLRADLANRGTKQPCAPFFTIVRRGSFRSGCGRDGRDAWAGACISRGTCFDLRRAMRGTWTRMVRSRAPEGRDSRPHAVALGLASYVTRAPIPRVSCSHPYGLALPSNALTRETAGLERAPARCVHESCGMRARVVEDGWAHRATLASENHRSGARIPDVWPARHQRRMRESSGIRARDLGLSCSHPTSSPAQGAGWMRAYPWIRARNPW